MKINKLELFKFDNLSEQKWFSYIKKLGKEMGFGTLKLTITIKNEEVTNIKVLSEESYSIKNS